MFRLFWHLSSFLPLLNNHVRLNPIKPNRAKKNRSFRRVNCRTRISALGQTTFPRAARLLAQSGYSSSVLFSRNKDSSPRSYASLFRFGIIKVLICLFDSKKMLESEVSDRLSVNPKSVRIPTDLDRPIALHQLKDGDRDIQG